jgi:hypothetical protein
MWPIRKKFIKHYTPPSAEGEICGMCFRENKLNPATHKVGEEFNEIFEESPKIFRHNLTQYVCCNHFSSIMGPLAKEWCKEVK